MQNDIIVIAELCARKSDLDYARGMIAQKQKTLRGRLPFVRSKLQSQQIHVDYQRARVDAAITYMTTISK